MNKEFIPYEQALELKELGFDEPCFFAFDSCSTPMRCTDLRTNEQKFYGVNYNSSTYTSQPTFSQAFRWFREKHQLCAWVKYEFEDDKITPTYYIISPRYTDMPGGAFDIYEEAELACLKKLIDILKGNLV